MRKRKTEASTNKIIHLLDCGKFVCNYVWQEHTDASDKGGSIYSPKYYEQSCSLFTLNSFLFRPSAGCYTT